jgi:nucleotide-binding universal stress UspA family protein
MNTNKRILIAVDASEASDRAVTYVARIIAGQPDFRVILFHVPAPIPPRYLEFGGRERPLEEEHAQTALYTARDSWIEQAKRMAQPVFARAQTLLRREAVPEQAVETQIAAPVSGQTLDVSILEEAQRAQCGTVVVGRTSWSWLQELWQQHVAEKLLPEAQGLALWIIQ